MLMTAAFSDALLSYLGLKKLISSAFRPLLPFSVPGGPCFSGEPEGPKGSAVP